MPPATPNLLVSLTAALLVCGMGAVLGTTETWLWPGALLFHLAGAGVFLAIGYFTAIAAMQHGEISLTAPFRYVAIVIAVALGFVIWGDFPDAATLIGSVVIMGAGLYALYRERRTLGRSDLAAAATRTPTGG
jgi:drug/metabolite transporter (DMT)-like permease